jgi:hypothetical protein
MRMTAGYQELFNYKPQTINYKLNSPIFATYDSLPERRFCAQEPGGSAG